MRYMKVSAQTSAEGAVSVVEFHDRARADVVYKARVDRFGSLQRVDAGDADSEAMTDPIEKFLSTANSDIRRMFVRHLQTGQNGACMELIAEGRVAQGPATGVRFRFFDAQGQMKEELLTRPETRQEKANRLQREAQQRNEIVRQAKQRGVSPPPVCETDDRAFMDRLCEAYIKSGW